MRSTHNVTNTGTLYLTGAKGPYTYTASSSYTGYVNKVISSTSTPGTIVDGGTASIDYIRSMASVNGTLYIGTRETDSAEVYRYDGGTNWTKVASSSTFAYGGGGADQADTVSSMANVGGTLYIGTDDGANGNAEIYRYDGGTNWTKISDVTSGTITSAAAPAISPYWADLPLASWYNTPAAVVTSATGTCQALAAASLSICLAEAPTMRSGSQRDIIPRLPPVNCIPKSLG